jgi:hypothetical protein
MTKESDLIDILNRKGAFLQKFCTRKIVKAGWRIEEEFPVTLRVSKGASNEIIESTGDIRAKKWPSDEELGYSLTAVVECKQRFEARWIFLEYEKAYKHSPKLLDLQYHPEQQPTRKASKEETAYYYTNVNLEELKGCSFCNIGKEIPESVERGDKKFDSIYASCRETVLATKSSSEEDRNELETVGNWVPDLFNTHNIYLPIVVTSADIDICKYNIEDFGESKAVKNASLRQVDWLAYDFPLPSYLQTVYKTVNPMDYTEMKKQTIFIVSFRKCEEFFRLLENYFETWSHEILHDLEEY